MVIFEGRSAGRIPEGGRAQRPQPPLGLGEQSTEPIPPWGVGLEDSLEQTKVAFRAAWERFYATLTSQHQCVLAPREAHLLWIESVHSGENL